MSKYILNFWVMAEWVRLESTASEASHTITLYYSFITNWFTRSTRHLHPITCLTALTIHDSLILNHINSITLSPCNTPNPTLLCSSSSSVSPLCRGSRSPSRTTRSGHSSSKTGFLSFRGVAASELRRTWGHTHYCRSYYYNCWTSHNWNLLRDLLEWNNLSVCTPSCFFRLRRTLQSCLSLCYTGNLILRGSCNWMLA